MKREKYLILDVPNLNGERKMFDDFDLELADAKDMTREIVEWKGWEKFDPATTLLVFPGNGAEIIRGYLPEKWLEKWQQKKVHAKRYWKPGENPDVTASRIFPGQMIIGIKNIVIIDDVVSSGITAKLLRRVNEPWFPGARWHIVTWIAQRARSTRGFDSIHTVLEAGDKNKKAPINSLSTLLSEMDIANSYAQRNFGEQADQLLQRLEDLRQKDLH